VACAARPAGGHNRWIAATRPSRADLDVLAGADPPSADRPFEGFSRAEKAHLGRAPPVREDDEDHRVE